MLLTTLFNKFFVSILLFISDQPSTFHWTKLISECLWTYCKPKKPFSFCILKCITQAFPLLGRNCFCYCPFRFLHTGSCCLSSEAGHRRCVRVAVPAGHVILRYGGLLELCALGTRWSDAEWCRQDDWKMLRFSRFVFRIATKPISQHKYQGPFHFQPNRLLFSDTSCQCWRIAEQRISIPTRKMDFPEHNCPSSCHIILLYLITELPMNFSWDKGIKHLSS